MNTQETPKQKPKKSKSFFQQLSQSPQRRVSFSKASRFSKSSAAWSLAKSSVHGPTNKSTPVPRATSFSRPSKSSLKSYHKTIGISTRNRNRDATSSTTVDSRRHSQNNPTPAHLKYGTFRRLSKFRKQSEDPEVPASSRPESKPVVVSCSIDNKKRLPSPKDPQSVGRSNPGIARPSIGTTPSRPASPVPRRPRLSLTTPIHLDIKPKKFPSMLWC